MAGTLIWQAALLTAGRRLWAAGPFRPASRESLQEQVAALLPLLDRQVVADGDIFQPIRPVLAEPDLAVFSLCGGVCIAEILATANMLLISSRMFWVSTWRASSCWLSHRLGIRLNNLLGKLELHADQIQSARAQVHGGESIALFQTRIGRCAPGASNTMPCSACRRSSGATGNSLADAAWPCALHGSSQKSSSAGQSALGFGQGSVRGHQLLFSIIHLGRSCRRGRVAPCILIRSDRLSPGCHAAAAPNIRLYQSSLNRPSPSVVPDGGQSAGRA